MSLHQGKELEVRNLKQLSNTGVTLLPQLHITYGMTECGAVRKGSDGLEYRFETALL